VASAIKNAPCVRAVEVDYSTGTATIGTDAGTPIRRQEIIDALAATPYRVEFIEQPTVKDE
jgi:cyanophycinase-like exopeptidase